MSMPANIVRSPSYPSTPLNTAIEQVGKIEAQYRSSQVDREVAGKILGYSGLNGPSAKTLAALAHYGLVERAGKGEMRVTARAQAILHPESPAERLEHLRAAALEPDLFREMQEKWPGIIPPEDGIETYLSRKGFNRTAIRPAARAYLETLLFLKQEGANESHGPRAAKVENAAQPNGDDGKITYGGARVGDWIDYESAGAIVNQEPMRVRAVSEDGAWVFVDGSETGLEMEQAIVTEPPVEEAAKRERPTLPLPKREDADQPRPGSRRAIFPLDEGDVTLVFPEGLSASGLTDLGDYLNIFLKKERAKAGKQKPGDPEGAA
jgi:SH3 domain (SH3b1 type)